MSHLSYIQPVPAVELAGAASFAEDALFAAWEDIASPPHPETGVKTVDLAKVICLQGQKTCVSLTSTDMPTMADNLFRMIQPETTADKPYLLVEAS